MGAAISLSTPIAMSHHNLGTAAYSLSSSLKFFNIGKTLTFGR